MVSDSATLILVAVRSGIRLSGQIRLAHVDATRRRELILPLPRFETRTDWREAVEFFTTPGLGTSYATADSHLHWLLAKAHDGTLTREGQVELSHLHSEYAYLKTAEEVGWDWADGSRAEPGDLAALFAVRQWQRRSLDPSPTVLQRLAGVLWEMGIDYASHQPDRFPIHGPLPRHLLAFFRGLDEASTLPEPWLSELVPRLFQAVSEPTSTPHGHAAGMRRSETLQQMTSGILQVVSRHVSPGGSAGANPVEDLAKKDRIADWGEYLMRQVVHWITSDVPTSSTESDIRSTTVDLKELPRVALDLLEAVVSDPARFDRALGSGSLTALLQAGVRLVGEHPSLSENGATGIPELLKRLADRLETLPHPQASQLLPALAERILHHAAEDPVRLWPSPLGASTASPLVTITGQILTLLFQASSNGASIPGFRPSDLVSIVDQVLNRCVESPDLWLQPDGTPAETLPLGIRRWLALLANPRRGRASPAQALRMLEDVFDASEGKTKSVNSGSSRTQARRSAQPRRPLRKKTTPS